MKDLGKANFPIAIESEKRTDAARRTKLELLELGFKTKQLVLCLLTKSGCNVSLSVAKLFGNISRSLKSENIHGNLSLESFVISSLNSNDKKVFLNPSSFQITANVFWETWQDPEEEPQIKIQAHSDNIYFDFGPRQMKMLESAIQEYHELMDYLNINSTTRDNRLHENLPVAEQYYKDDLKAGAFQFVNGNVEEMPLPYQVLNLYFEFLLFFHFHIFSYRKIQFHFFNDLLIFCFQVVFYTHPKKGMAWRYPQPRIITGLFVSPIPFEASIYIVNKQPVKKVEPFP